MPELSPRQIALYALAVLALMVLAVWYLEQGRDGGAAAAQPAAAPAIEVKEEDDGGALVVHVCLLYTSPSPRDRS